MLERLDFNDNPNIGVYCRANDSTIFVPPLLPKKILKSIKKTLDVTPVPLSIAKATIIGSLMVMNSKGVMITEFADSKTITTIEQQQLKVEKVYEVINAAGNDILVNDHAALVHPLLKPKTIKAIEKTMDVPVTKGTIAGLPTVGMAAVVTNKGCLCHPKITEEEKQVLEQTFNVEVMIGTVNHGFPMIGSGLVANSNGAIIGNHTTGIEMGRIEEALGFLE
jgi:translation initiation factor 6